MSWMPSKDKNDHNRSTTIPRTVFSQRQSCKLPLGSDARVATKGDLSTAVHCASTTTIAQRLMGKQMGQNTKGVKCVWNH